APGTPAEEADAGRLDCLLFAGSAAAVRAGAGADPGRGRRTAALRFLVDDPLRRVRPGPAADDVFSWAPSVSATAPGQNVPGDDAGLACDGRGVDRDAPDGRGTAAAAAGGVLRPGGGRHHVAEARRLTVRGARQQSRPGKRSARLPGTEERSTARSATR